MIAVQSQLPGSTARTSRATPPARTRRARDSRDTPALTRASLPRRVRVDDAPVILWRLARPRATEPTDAAAERPHAPVDHLGRHDDPVVAGGAGYGCLAVRDRTSPRVQVPLAHSGRRRASFGCARIAVRRYRGC